MAATVTIVISGSGTVPGDQLAVRALKMIANAGWTIDSATMNGVAIRTALQTRLVAAAMLAYTEPAHSAKVQDQALVRSIVDRIIDTGIGQ